MREQRQQSEWILSSLSGLRLRFGCTKHPCCHLFGVVVTELVMDHVLSEIL